MDILFSAHWRKNKSGNLQADWPAASGIARLLVALAIITGGVAALDRAAGQSQAEAVAALSYSPASQGSPI